MAAMTGFERIGRALAGELVDRTPTGPLAVHFCARDAGVSIERYTRDAQTLADSVVRYYERHRPDAVWISADTWVTAEAMGAAVAFPAADQPMCGVGEALIQSAADIDRLPEPDPTSRGRMPIMLDAAALVRKALGGEAFIVGCFDQLPFSLACALMGLDQVMLALVDDPPMLDALLERCVEHVVAYGRALGEAGVDMLSAGDSPAGLIGPDMYRRFALPAERRVFEGLRRVCDLPLSLHICGDMTHILKDMTTTGADVIEFDYQVDARAAGDQVGEKVALWGNLDPVAVLSRGTPEAVRAASSAVIDAMRERGHRRFVLSSGCTLAPDTPRENLHAMIDAAGRGATIGRGECE